MDSNTVSDMDLDGKDFYLPFLNTNLRKSSKLTLKDLGLFFEHLGFPIPRLITGRHSRKSYREELAKHQQVWRADPRVLNLFREECRRMRIPLEQHDSANALIERLVEYEKLLVHLYTNRKLRPPTGDAAKMTLSSTKDEWTQLKTVCEWDRAFHFYSVAEPHCEISYWSDQLGTDHHGSRSSERRWLKWGNPISNRSDSDDLLVESYAQTTMVMVTACLVPFQPIGLAPSTNGER
jgi:hypothetical protein